VGTDIHIVVERRYAGKDWELLDPATYPESLHARNYSTFAILANVRNGYGFAGIPTTATAFEPISEPRGYPDGFIWPDGCGWRLCEGDHDFSWVTLAELMAVTWERKITKLGVVESQIFDSWDGQSQPSDWWGDIYGDGIVIQVVTPEQYRAGRRGVKATYVRITWEVTYKQAVGSFWDALTWLKKEAAGDAEIRLVFGFDS